MGWLEDIWNGVESVANIATGGIYGAIDNAWTKATDNGAGGSTINGINAAIGSPAGQAGLNLAGGWLSGETAKQLQEDANRANMQEAQRNRDFQREGQGREFDFNSDQARLSREFNSKEAGVARQYNSAEAEKMRLFNAAEVQKTRDYESMMSNTAYQRAMADMKKAGLNPMLAYMQGGASTPNVGSASGGSASSGSASSSPAHGGGVSGSQGVARASAAAELQARAIEKSLSSAFEAKRLGQEIKESSSRVQLNEEMKNTQRSIQHMNMSTSARSLAEANKYGLESQHLISDSHSWRSTAEAKKAAADISKQPWYQWMYKLTDLVPLRSVLSK